MIYCNDRELTSYHSCVCILENCLPLYSDKNKFGVIFRLVFLIIAGYQPQSRQSVRQPACQSDKPVSQRFCKSVYRSVCKSGSHSFCQSVCLSVNQNVLSGSQSTSLSIRQSVSYCVSKTFNQCARQSLCQSVCLCAD